MLQTDMWCLMASIMHFTHFIFICSTCLHKHTFCYICVWTFPQGGNKAGTFPAGKEVSFFQLTACYISVSNIYQCSWKYYFTQSLQNKSTSVQIVLLYISMIHTILVSLTNANKNRYRVQFLVFTVVLRGFAMKINKAGSAANKNTGLHLLPLYNT